MNDIDKNEHTINLFLMAIKTLKMYYEYGMVNMIVRNSGFIEEKGTHQNHVLELIITKLHRI